MRHLVWCVVMLAAMVSGLFAADFTAVSGKTNWTQRVSFHCDETPLSELFAWLANSYHFTFFLDRRVDPGMLVACQQPEAPLIEALANTVERCGLSWCILQSHIYIGPKDAAGQLLLSTALTRQKYAKTGGPYSALARVSTLEGKQFCQPRMLLERLARDAGLSWNGLDRMPLDCWSAFFVSPLPIADQMQMLLIGFGVRFELDESTSTLKPVPLDDGHDVTRIHAANTISPDMHTSYSHCRFETGSRHSNTSVRVTGPYAELAQLEDELMRARIKSLCTSAAQVSQSARATGSGSDRKASSRKGKKEVTGTIENKTLEEVFEAIGPVFDVKLKLDESLTARGITLKTRISCKFARTGLKSTLDIVGAELNAQHRQEGDEIVFSDNSNKEK
ncbi:MAG: hypothetical protein PHQ75_13080 [Thermoguttaceae bacterium]|nr:hypothetical protein [Thermoguttaceae bacterium]